MKDPYGPHHLATFSSSLCAVFGQLQRSDARLVVGIWPAWGNFYNEIHLGAARLCALLQLSIGEQDCVTDSPFKMGHEW